MRDRAGGGNQHRLKLHALLRMSHDSFIKHSCPGLPDGEMLSKGRPQVQVCAGGCPLLSIGLVYASVLRINVFICR